MRTVFPLGVHLDEHLLGAHHLDDLADVRARLLQQAQLLPEQAYPRVVVIALGFETAEDGLTLEDLELHRLDLVVVVVVERHDDGVARWFRWVWSVGSAGSRGSEVLVAMRNLLLGTGPVD